MLGYLQIAIAAIAGLLGTLCDLRSGRQLTRVGKLFAFVAIVGVVLALVEKAQQRQEQSSAPMLFDLAKVRIELDASYWLPAFTSDSVLIAHSPAELAIRDARLGEYPLHFEFKGTRTPYRPTPPRSIPPSHLYYSGDRLRSAGSARLPFRYLWDLDGQIVTFRLPSGAFSRASGRQDWVLQVAVTVGNRTNRAYVNERGEVQVLLAGLSRDSLQQ